MNKKYFIYSASAIFVVFAIYRLVIFGTQPVSPAISITASPVIQKTVTVQLETIGTVQAFNTVDIKSMVNGQLIEIGFKEGDVVQQNQVLFKLDDRPFIAALDQAKADLARDKATLANNLLQVKRGTALAKKGYLSKQDFDNLQATATAMAATVKADEANVANAIVQLDYTTIHAPITGTTGNILLKVGSIIKANDTVTLVTINQINPIKVVFSVPQSKLPTIQRNRVNQAIPVQAMISKDMIEEGELIFIDNSIDTTTGTIQLKATFPNEQRRLWPGQYVRVMIPTETLQNALLIPSLALLSGQNGFYVYVIDESQLVHTRRVVPGAIIGSDTVIESGLSLGEKVVTSGQLRLKEGDKVNIADGQ